MKHYFVADVHLACRAFTPEQQQDVEQAFTAWLREIAARQDTAAIYLLGDIFDFWFEFSGSVPRCYDHTLAALEAVARQVPVHFIPGNHDQWTYGYLARLGLTVEPKLVETVIGGHRILLAHGHSLNCKSRAVRVMNRVFESRGCQWAFRHLIVPKLGLEFGFRWSASNHMKHNQTPEHDTATIDYYADHGGIALPDEQEEWCKGYVQARPDTDIIIMGHRHRGANLMLSDTQLLILDSFFNERAYAVIDERPFSLSELYFQR